MEIKAGPNEQPKVATLAVGTEITDGQISDRNSQWLSARVVTMGYEVIEHRVVADDRPRILASLEALSREVTLILVTGGLGPTSDDFTRECVAEFLGQPLEWDEPSWQRILERLQARGANVTENQKQQCYFPRGATILKNSNGTANAFTALTPKGVRVVSLPGPPGEIAGIWNDGLAELLKLPVQAAKRDLTLLRTMGVGEGALASGVEDIMTDVMAAHPDVTRPTVGYRAHAPYVEVKLWADRAQASAVREIANRVRQKYSDILINEGSADLADEMLARIATEAAAGIKTMIYDGLTNGECIARLYARARETGDTVAQEALASSCVCVVDRGFQISHALLKPEAKTSVLALARGAGPLEILVSRGAREKQIELPKLAGQVDSERGRKWAIEYALREWSHT